MRRLIPLFLVAALALGGCGGINAVTQTYEKVTGTGIPIKQINIARRSFLVVEATATNYITYCKVHPTVVGCSQGAIDQLIPAVRSGRVARQNIVQFIKDNPGTTLGPSGAYNLLVQATATVNAVQAQYNIGAK